MGIAQLGAMHSASFAEDPKHLGFVLARYKFVAKMLTGKTWVLEIGCGDCTGARVVKEAVGGLIGCDKTLYDIGGLTVVRHDMAIGPLPLAAVVPTQQPSKSFEAAYALDVFEHIYPSVEDQFLRNVGATIDSAGVFIVGTPSLESQPYASELSRAYHVNCKTEEGLRETMSKHFRNVFIFGMNDETIHTGFGPMCHYRFAVCVGPRF